MDPEFHAPRSMDRRNRGERSLMVFAFRALTCKALALSQYFAGKKQSRLAEFRVLVAGSLDGYYRDFQNVLGAAIR